MVDQLEDLEQELMGLCRRWLLEVHSLRSAHAAAAKQQAVHTDSTHVPQVYQPGRKAGTHPSTATATRPTAGPDTHTPQQDVLLELHAEELHAALRAFLAFSERTGWHTSTTRVSPLVWLQIIESRLLQVTADALLLIRPRHVPLGLTTTHTEPSLSGPDTVTARMRHAILVGPLHEAALSACGILVSAVHGEVAPVEMWRPVLEQLLEPRTNGFLLLLQDVLVAMVDVSHVRPHLLAEPNEPEGALTGAGLSALLPGWVTGGQSKSPDSTSAAQLPPEQSRRAQVTQEVTLLGSTTGSSPAAEGQETGGEEVGSEGEKHGVADEAQGITSGADKQSHADTAGTAGQLTPSEQGVHQTTEGTQPEPAGVPQAADSKRGSSDGGRPPTVLREASFYVPRPAGSPAAESPSDSQAAAEIPAGALRREPSLGHIADSSQGPDLAAAIAATSPRKQPQQGGVHRSLLLPSWGGPQAESDGENGNDTQGANGSGLSIAAQEEKGPTDGTQATNRELDSPATVKDGSAASSPKRHKQGILKQAGTLFGRGASGSLSPRSAGPSTTPTPAGSQAATPSSALLLQPTSPGGLRSASSPVHSPAGSSSPQPTARHTQPVAQQVLGSSSSPPVGMNLTSASSPQGVVAGANGSSSPQRPVWERHHAQHADPTAPTQSQVSRSAVLCALHLLRDLNEVAARESTARRQGSGGGPGSMRQFLASLLDLRAVLAGLLHEMRLLPLMVDMYRRAEDVGCTREELFPLLEAIVAMAASASSPDLPTPGGIRARPGGADGDVRVFTSAMDAEVLRFITDELHSAHASVAAEVRAHLGTPHTQLPKDLQARLDVLRHLVECMVIFAAAPLPPLHPIPTTPSAGRWAPASLSALLPTQTPRSPNNAAEQQARVSLHKDSIGGQSNAGGGGGGDGDSEAASSPGRHAEGSMTRRSGGAGRSSLLRQPSMAPLSSSFQRPSLSRAGSNRDGLPGGGGGGGQGEEQSPLKRVVMGVLGSLRMFSAFAGCDIPYFCNAADACLLTVKTMARRLAVEGQVDLVEDAAFVVCEMLATMTDAMVEAAAAAHAADIEATKRAEALAAAGLTPPSSTTTTSPGPRMSTLGTTSISGVPGSPLLMLRSGAGGTAGGNTSAPSGPPGVPPIPAMRQHKDRPYGWGAGASRNGMPRHVSVAALLGGGGGHGGQQSMAGGWGGGRASDAGGLAITPRNPWADNDYSLTLLSPRASARGLAASMAGGVDVEDGSTLMMSKALMPGMGALLGLTRRSSSRTSGVSSLAITPRKPGEHALWRSEGGVGAGAAGKDASSAPGAGKGAEAAAAAPKSELWKLWAALGLDAEGNPLPEELISAATQGMDPSAAWPGLPREYVSHFEEVLRDVLRTLVHLLRGYLLPMRWGVVPLGLMLLQRPASPSPQPPGTPLTPALGIRNPLTPSHATHTNAEGQLQPPGNVAIPASPSVTGGLGSPTRRQGAPTPRSTLAARNLAVSAYLGQRLFKPGAAPSLPESDIMGEVPLKVGSLVESLVSGGLLRALEALFSLELSSDKKYFSHYAAMEAALQGGHKKGGASNRLDRIRLLASRLMSDCFTAKPQLAGDRPGAYLLRAVRKFLTAHAASPAPTAATSVAKAGGGSNTTNPANRLSTAGGSYPQPSQGSTLTTLSAAAPGSGAFPRGTPNSSSSQAPSLSGLLPASPTSGPGAAGPGGAGLSGQIQHGGGSTNSSIVWSVGDPRQSLSGAAGGSTSGATVRGYSVTGTGPGPRGVSYTGSATGVVTGGGGVGRASPQAGTPAPPAPPFTTYCLSSLVAISQELLPIPRIAAARAAADIELTAAVGGTWIPSITKSRGAALILLHTWTPITALLLAMLAAANVDPVASRPAGTAGATGVAGSLGRRTRPSSPSQDGGRDAGTSRSPNKTMLLGGLRQEHSRVHDGTSGGGAGSAPQSPRTSPPRSPVPALPLHKLRNSSAGGIGASAGLAGTLKDGSRVDGVGGGLLSRMGSLAGGPPDSPLLSAASRGQGSRAGSVFEMGLGGGGGHSTHIVSRGKQGGGLLGSEQARLAARTVTLAPLHRLFEAWLQQVYQVIMTYPHIEVLQSALEVVALHGGALDLLCAVLQGGHYTLTLRAQPSMAEAAAKSWIQGGARSTALPLAPSQGSLPGAHSSMLMIQQLSSSSGHLLARQPSLGLPLTPAQALAASTNSQSGQLMMAALTSALQDPVLGQYRTPEEQRDLRWRQKLLDREHGLSGLALISLEEALCLVHELCRPSLAPRMATCGLMPTLFTAVSSVHRHQISAQSMMRALSAAHHGLSRATSMAGVLSRATSMAGGALSRPASAHARSGSPTHLHASGGFLQHHHSSPFAVSGALGSQTQDHRPGSPGDKNNNSNTGLGQSQGSLKPGGTSTVTFAVPADPPGNSSKQGGTATASNTTTHERSHSPSAPAGYTEPAVVHSSPFAHTSMVAPGGGMSSGLTLPRAGIWLLMGSSVIKRCVCSVALNVATLAEARLGVGGGAVERYGQAGSHVSTSVGDSSVRLQAATGARPGDPAAPSGSAAARPQPSDSGRMNAGGTGVDHNASNTTRPGATQRPGSPSKGSSTPTSGPAPPSSNAYSGAGGLPGALEVSRVQPMLLLQSMKDLLITCKQWAGSGSELLGALTAIPRLLDPATQLRTLVTELRPMTRAGVEAAREAGTEIAASAIAVVDRAAEAAGALPAGLTPRTRLQQQQQKPGSPIPAAGASTQHAGAQPRSPAPTAAPPALVPGPGSAAMPHSSLVGAGNSPSTGPAGQGGYQDTTALRLKPALSVVLPPGPSDEDGDTGQQSPAPTPSPQKVLSQGLIHGAGGSMGVGAATGADLAAYLGVGSLPWEAHASCLSVGPLKDRLWLEGTRVGQQRHQMQVVLDVMQGSEAVFSPLPPVELTGALPGLTDSLHLVGCCNARCVQRVPGLPERSVGLRKCAACKRVAWCSDACREAANAEGGQHHAFCHWACLLLEL